MQLKSHSGPPSLSPTPPVSPGPWLRCVLGARGAVCSVLGAGTDLGQGRAGQGPHSLWLLQGEPVGSPTLSPSQPCLGHAHLTLGGFDEQHRGFVAFTARVEPAEMHKGVRLGAAGALGRVCWLSLGAHSVPGTVWHTGTSLRGTSTGPRVPRAVPRCWWPSGPASVLSPKPHSGP